MSNVQIYSSNLKFIVLTSDQRYLKKFLGCQNYSLDGGVCNFIGLRIISSFHQNLLNLPQFL